MRWVALVVVAAACGGTRPAKVIDGAVAAGLAQCTGRPFTTPTAAGWDHRRSRLVDALGSSRHHAQDVIAPPGAPAQVAARFAYGKTLKDLEDETVMTYVDDCQGWVELGESVTDDDGQVLVTLPADLTPGVHEVRFAVRGDASQAAASAWILPAGTRIVVTDVDGTMTTDDAQLFQNILDGDHVPVAYPGSAALTRAHVANGAVVVYLTGRPYWLLARTRRWLDDLDFAAGPIHVADSHDDILPTDEHVGAYKRAWLAGLIAAGYVIEVAYGNASTDVFAYLAAGLDPARVFIIGKHAGKDGTQPVVDSWEPRVDVVKKTPLLDPAERRTPR